MFSMVPRSRWSRNFEKSGLYNCLQQRWPIHDESDHSVKVVEKRHMIFGLERKVIHKPSKNGNWHQHYSHWFHPPNKKWNTLEVPSKNSRKPSNSMTQNILSLQKTKLTATWVWRLAISFPFDFVKALLNSWECLISRRLMSAFWSQNQPLNLNQLFSFHTQAKNTTESKTYKHDKKKHISPSSPPGEGLLIALSINSGICCVFCAKTFTEVAVLFMARMAAISSLMLPETGASLGEA